ncbi:MAG: helix-turn-helix transcriptional regulator [Firmicutes bacterium]|nr:helix-turn-helix transcriptional regulator [Alicyclobacillaceae bacterium]MCL6498116.1 helix-turn-helix transcriptional regulator [Bacillota bacterium]
MARDETTIQARMRKVRKMRRMTQQEVADLLGISRDYYQKIESGVRSPNLRLIQRFCDQLGVPQSVLLGEENPEASLMAKWPKGYYILRRAAEGPAWRREQLEKLFEVVFGEPPDADG